MSRTKWFTHKSANAKLTIWDDKNATVSNVFSVRRGQGQATRVIQHICKYADDNGMSLLLEVQQYGYADGDSPDNSGLKRWYRSFGFVSCEGNRMVRTHKIQRP